MPLFRDAATFSSLQIDIRYQYIIAFPIQPLGQSFSPPWAPPVTMAVWPLVFDTFMFLLNDLDILLCPALKRCIFGFSYFLQPSGIEFSLYYIIYVGMCPHIFFFMLECVDFSVGL